MRWMQEAGPAIRPCREWYGLWGIMKKKFFPEKDDRITNISEKDVPKYYREALKSAYFLMTLYFLCFVIYVIPFPELRRDCHIVLVWLITSALVTFCSNRIPIRWNLLCFVTLTITWIIEFVVRFGWDCGVQHFIIPLMIVSLFSIYDTLVEKLAFCAGLFLLRMILFFYCLNHEPKVILTQGASIAFQIISTSFMFFIVGYTCMIFSTNIQKSEKQLMTYNQELRELAVTDPLTKLYNRRRMQSILERDIESGPNSNFCVAMGDIDLFKRINDTYGHNFGDVVLRSLADLFRERMNGKGEVCRWGGEEFFFYLRGMNLDEASTFINDLHIAVSRLLIEDKDVSVHVTMTFGVEEYDFQSDIKGLVKRADDKLYYGKEHGRNRVIF